jgi:hypothetical protein
MENIAPWRVLRPFSRFVDSQNLERIKDKSITVFLLLPEWVNMINPADPIELVDREDLQRWVLGIVTFVKKVVMKSALPSDIQQSLVAQLHPKLSPDQVGIDEVCSVLTAYYEEPITLESMVAIIGIQVEDVSVPQYYLRFDDET